MLLSCVIVGIFYMWMLCETDFLRVRLPTGNTKSNEYIKALSEMLDANFAEIDRYLVIKPKILELPQFCKQTELINQYKNSRYKPEWADYGYKDSYQSITLGKSTIKIKATLPNLHDLIKEAEKIQSEKHKPVQILKANYNSQITLINLNSFGEKGKETPEYHGLVTHEWYLTHSKDEYLEPTMELLVDNGKSIHVNGNYKKGIITNFMSKYTEKVRAGRKSIRINKGESVVNCGGGVYIAEKVTL